MPASRLFLLLALTTVAGVAGVVAPSWAVVALVLDGVAVAAFAVDYARARGATLTAERRWPPLLVQGVEAEVRVALQHGSPRPLTVRLRDGLHAGLASAPQRTELLLPAERRSRWSYRLRPSRRGEHESGPLTARVLGPWGLAWHQRWLLPGERRRVFPQVRWEGKVGRLLLLAHRRALGRHPQQVRGLGSEPYALREYLPGDPPSKIHWKATARHGRLVSREDTWERGARLIVLLDCARSMAGRAGERGKLDHALAASLALSRVAVSRGDRVTVVAFADRVLRSVRLHGGRDLPRAYGALYDLQAELTEPSYDVAAEEAVRLESRRSITMLFTSVVDIAASELLRRSLLTLERRHRPILIHLQDPELLDLAYAPPDTPQEAFAKVAALEILLANRRLGQRLRHAGIRIVSAPADRLALGALEAYLASFRIRR